MIMNTTEVATSPAIEFRNVSVSFDGRPALIEINLQLDRTEMMFLTGISGSGNSVLLRLAMGLIKPDSGQIFIEGREIETLSESDLLSIRGGVMGIVFQEDSLFSGLTVYENAAYRLEDHGWPAENIEQAATEVLRFVGLDGEQSKLPEELSGGMKRRLEIARAMIGWPRIMLFDEPTMSLDPIMALQVRDLVIRARDINHISSIYVTKKIYEIAHLANFRATSEVNGDIVIDEMPEGKRSNTKVVILEAGRIAFNGTVEEFQKSSLPVMRDLSTLDHHNHLDDPYFIDPWDKRRRPTEAILSSRLVKN